MAKNKKNIDYSRSGKIKIRHWPKYIGVFMLFLGCAVLAGYLYLLRNVESGESLSVTKSESRTVNIVRGKQLINSKYFSYEGQGDWRYREADSVPDKYYYFSEYKNEKVVRHVRVFVNSTYSKYQVQHVIPVVQDGSALSVTDYNDPEHCNQQGNQNVETGDRVVVMHDTEFLCDTDASDRRAAAVLVGSGYAINSPAESAFSDPYTLIIEYHDVTLNPDLSIFTEILDSFRFK